MPLSSILTEEWLWIIILSLILILILPLVVVWVILKLPPILKVVATVVLITGWGIVAGYKDWILSKRKEKERA